jgi:WD40 repeat protein/serine/threonine protein kinase
MAEAKEAALSPGAQVDSYQVVRLVGRGGMGEVYLARDAVLGRKVALKVLNPDTLGDGAALERFLFEAQVTARFNHPHIVTVYGVGQYQERPYVALEYLEGQTLRDRIRDSRLGVIEAARVGLAVAEALSEAHVHQVLHRDLKPANVLIPRDGRPRVVDFGLAKALPERPSALELAERITWRPSAPPAVQDDGDELLGTPAYMAPEQWISAPVTAASDIWALGVILFETLSGRRPYNEPTVYLQCAAVCSEDLAPSLTTPEQLPPALTAVVAACLEKDPADRPTAREVAETLHGIVFKRSRIEGEVSPFRGLLPFTERHADLFFGRDDEISSFLERMRDDPVLAVVGPSGAGKSSFVQAGVIPRLREQGRWQVLALRPGRQPFEALAGRLVRGESEGYVGTLPGSSSSIGMRSLRSRSTDRGRRQVEEQRLTEQLSTTPGLLSLTLLELAEREDARVLLFVDQLEELYTQVHDEDTRRRFMEAVCGAADDGDGPVRVVLTMRDDFMVRLAETPLARQALGHVAVLRSPGPDALREILVSPLEQVGYRYEDPTLVDTMVDAVGGEPASLPLLQFACSRLWERRGRNRRILLHAEYEAMGGVAGALAGQADGALEGLTKEQLGIARDILLRLVTPEGARRVIPRDELIDGMKPEATEILDRLIRGRTIIAHRGRGASAGAEVELVHESLVRSWDRLRRWIEGSREELKFLAEIEQAAELWERRGQRDEEVWQRDALHDAERRARQLLSVPEPVRRFLDAGRRLERRRATRRRVMLATGMVLLLAVAVTSLIVALALSDKERRAQEQRQQAETRRAEALLEGARAAQARGDLIESRAKLRGSLEVVDSAAGRALLWNLEQEQLALNELFPNTVYDLSYAPDGRRIAVAYVSKAVAVIDIETREIQTLRGQTDQVVAVAFSPDGRHLAYGTWEGSIGLWDLENETTAQISPGKSVLWRLAYAPNGELLASCHADSRVRIWNLKSGGEPRILEGHTAEASAIAISADGKRLATGSYDNSVIVWDLDTGRQLYRLVGHEDPVYSLAFSPDGSRLASGSDDKTIRLWDPRSGTAHEVLRGHAAGVYGLKFALDGSRLYSGGYDRMVLSWDLAASGRPAVIGRHEGGEVECLALSPDGRLLASGGFDRMLRLWNLDAVTDDAQEHGHTGPVWSVATDPSGERLASAGRDGAIRIWDVGSGDQTMTIRTDADDVYRLSFSPDGKLLACASSDRVVRVWQLPEATEPRPYDGNRSWVLGVAFSPDGKLLAAGGNDRIVRVWDVATAELLHELEGHTAEIRDVDFSHDGKLLASAGWDGTVHVWELEGGPGRTLVEPEGWVYAVSFNPLGPQLVASGEDKRIHLWDVRTWGSRVVAEHEARVHDIAFHPDGKLVGTTSTDGTAWIHDLEGGEPIGLRGHRNVIHSIDFAGQGQLAATTGADETVRLWDVKTGSSLWRAPLVLSNPPRMLNHQGWHDLANPERAAAPGDSSWRRAVEQEARSASRSADGKTLCLATMDGHLELWATVPDRRQARQSAPRPDRVLALNGGCVAITADQGVILLTADGVQTLTGRASSITANRSRILAAADDKVEVFGATGEHRRSISAVRGASAVALGQHGLILGFDDGSIQVAGEGGGSPCDFEETPSSEVVSLIEGPMGTVIAGFASGALGIWNASDGKKLAQAKIHGPALHLLIEGEQLFAVSELGDHLVLDLAIFHRPYCDLLRGLWKSVPVAWEKGRPIRRAPPAKHPCAAE